MKSVRNDDEPGHRLIIDDIEIGGQEVKEVSDGQALQLQTDPHVNITVLEDAPDPNPEEPFENYSLLNAEDARDALIAAREDDDEGLAEAIAAYERANAARVTVLNVVPPKDEPEAEGAGHTDNDDDQEDND